MNRITYIQCLELVDIAADENRLWHHNGGQAYIQMSHESNALMIVDHGTINTYSIEIMDGTQYFEAYKGANWEQSRRLREHGSLAKWYIENFPQEVSA